jgi:hypothetical protein
MTCYRRPRGAVGITFDDKQFGRTSSWKKFDALEKLGKSRHVLSIHASPLGDLYRLSSVGQDGPVKPICRTRSWFAAEDLAISEPKSDILARTYQATHSVEKAFTTFKAIENKEASMGSRDSLSSDEVLGPTKKIRRTKKMSGQLVTTTSRTAHRVH